MGNNIAPILAIIYMHHIEEKIKLLCNGAVHFFVRYIDDVFFIVDKYLNIDSLLRVANSVNNCIQFTHEMPNENQALPFLDTLISYTPELNTTLYVKPIHSNSILHSSSCVPKQRKVNLIRNEFDRATKCSNNPISRQNSTHLVKARFIKNGYENTFLNKAINKRQSDTENREEPISFIKLPYQNEATCRKIRQLLTAADLNKSIRVIFETRPPLSRLLAPKKEAIKCPKNCISCRLAVKEHQCTQKAIIYFINCSICNFEYVGESKRCAGSRIKDHTQKEDSLVFQHMRLHHPRHPLKWRWKILGRIDNWYARTTAENLIAQQHGLLQQKVREINDAIFFNPN